MPDANPPYSVEFEAKGTDIQRIRGLLEQIELHDDLRRFRIEIDSDKPIFSKSPTEESETDTSDSPKSEAEPVENGFEKFEKNGSQNDCKIKSHTEKPRPGIKPYRTGTHKFKVLAILYRQNEPLRLGHIHAYLEGTDWETTKSTISSALSNAKNKDLVQKEEIPRSTYDGWTLTDRGKEKMAKTVEEESNYPLTIADKICGLHPTDNFPQPNLEA